MSVAEGCRWHAPCPERGMNSSSVFGLTVAVGALAGVVFAGALAGCQTDRPNTAREAAIGAAAGAVIGGVIGNQSGEAGNGAAIGAAVGGVAGAAHGSGRDREVRERENDRNSSDFYRELLTDNEVATLEARARHSGRENYRLTDFLTEQEKENLRRRHDRLENRPIGS